MKVFEARRNNLGKLKPAVGDCSIVSRRFRDERERLAIDIVANTHISTPTLECEFAFAINIFILSIHTNFKVNNYILFIRSFSIQIYVQTKPKASLDWNMLLI